MTPLRSLRWRLLLQYLLTVGLLLFVAESALYTLFRWAGRRELDTELRKEVEKLASAVEVDPKGKPKVKAKKELSRKQAGSRTIAWEVLGDQGRVMARSSSAAEVGRGLPALEPPELGFEEMRIGDVSYGDVVRGRAARLRTLRQRPDKAKQSAQQPQQRVFDIRVVVDRTAASEEAERLAWHLVGGFPFLLGLAWLGGVYLIRRAVRPVELAFARERRFTGAASHELRTPLTALRGEIDITLRRERTPEEHQDALRRMSVLVDRMTDLIEGMLVLARAEAGHLLHGAEEATVREFLASVREMVPLLAGCERVTVHSSVPEEAVFVGSRLLLTLALRNLIENSQVHVPEGPVLVNLAVNASGALEVTVRDRGPGIPVETLAHSAIEGQTRRHGLSLSGAGLGLSIARAIIEAHGGSLHFEHLAGEGYQARICLALPADLRLASRSPQRTELGRQNQIVPAERQVQ